MTRDWPRFDGLVAPTCGLATSPETWPPGNVRQNPDDTSARPEEDAAMPDSNGRGRPQRPGRKEAALRASRTLNLRPQDVTDEQFAGGEFFDARDMAQVKYEMVRKNRAGGASVTAAAAASGLSRQSFYQAAAALDGGGLAALVPGRPGPKGGHKLTGEVIAWITERKAASQALTAAQLAALVEGQFGIRVHPRSVQRVLARPKRTPTTSTRTRRWSAASSSVT
jgi:transposase